MLYKYASEFGEIIGEREVKLSNRDYDIIFVTYRDHKTLSFMKRG